jgi:glycosyltransferase involved in cell wall biosynthesis
MSSIVIPAYNESGTIGPLLDRLQPLAETGTEVIVVCNGCTDNTATIARSRGNWVTVAELSEGSKTKALEEGDRLAASFPRLYLDADVVIDSVSIAALFSALECDGLEAAAAVPHYDLSNCSWTVKSYFRFWRLLPTNQTSISGTNAMAITEKGRERFREWPNLIGDDYFLDGLFRSDEKQRISSAIVWRPTPRRFADHVSRSARVYQGNLDIRAAGLRSAHGGGGLRNALPVMACRPESIIDFPSYVVVSVAARALAWWRRRNGSAQMWYRDSSRAEY